MTRENNTRLRAQFPQDLAALLSLYWIIIPVMLVASRLGIMIFNTGRTGDTTLIWIAIGFGAVGVVILFFSRLPLYRCRKWLQIGPRGLDVAHRRLYGFAWILILLSIGILGLLVLILR